MLPTWDNRFVVVLVPYPSQQAKVAQIFHCALVEEQMTQEARKWVRLPGGVNVVVDFLCGMMCAPGVQAALIRRAHEGGSYRITVTLAQVTTFEMSLGLNDKAQLLDIGALGPEHQIQLPNIVTRMTPFGELTRLASQVEMSKIPEYWTDPILVPLGSSRPEWLPKA